MSLEKGAEFELIIVSVVVKLCSFGSLARALPKESTVKRFAYSVDVKKSLTVVVV